MPSRHRLFVVYTLVSCLVGAFVLTAADERPPASRSKKQRVPMPKLPPGTRVIPDLDYVGDGHERHTLDLYLPRDVPAKPLPLVVWVHGGGWRKGDKSRTPARGLVADGFAVASINYRLSQHAPFPAQIEDCKAAIRWLRAHASEYHLDPDRIAVWGASAGGHLVALLGTSGDRKEFDVGKHLDQSSRVQAVCDWYGPTQFVPLGVTAERAARSPRNVDSPIAMLLGGPISENIDKASLASPMEYVSGDDPPFLILHGEKDKLVPLDQSTRFAEKLEAAGVPVELVVFPEAAHGGAEFIEAIPRISTFFQEQLQGTK